MISKSTSPFFINAILILISTCTVFCSFAGASGSGHGNKFVPDKYNCAGIDNRIDKINDRMRQGYKVREGERLKEELRQLKKKRYSCRKKGYSVK